MDKTVQRVVSFFIEHGSAQEDNRDLYQYGATIFLSTIVNLLITVAIGFIVGMPLLMLTYFIPFILIRGFTGGYHAKTFWGCVATSTGIIVGVVFLLRFISETLYLPLAGIVFVASGIIIYKLAPVVSSNRRIGVENYGVMRKRAFLALGVVVVACVVLFVVDVRQHMFSASLGLGVASVMLTIRRRKTHTCEGG